MSPRTCGDRPALRVSAEVEAAVAGGRPVVALESTVFSRLGLPDPAGREAYGRVLDALRRGGALPALTVVLDGVARVGIDDADAAAHSDGDGGDGHHDRDGDMERVFRAERKVGERDLGVAVAQRWPAAATTVSASVALAATAGIQVFATGGIGAVHRDWPDTGDESADLGALARHPVVTVCAGAKAFLDLPRTLERLETLGVPVLGLGTDDGEFPAFWSRRSGLRVPHTVGSAAGVAGVVRAARALGYGGGILVVTPVPEADEVPYEELRSVIEAALVDAQTAGITGGSVTPFVLERIAAATGGRTVAANLALIEHNAEVAAAIAGALQPATDDEMPRA